MSIPLSSALPTNSLCIFGSHKATVYLSGDGNFHQPLKKKNNDEDDKQLIEAFHALCEVFDAYLEQVIQANEVGIQSRFILPHDDFHYRLI